MNHRHSAILGFCMLLLTLYGCAFAPKPPGSDVRAQLGRIGVLALPSTPRVEFKTFAKGWAAGVAKGGAFGAFEGILSSLTEVLRNPPSGPYALPAILITAVVVTTAHTVIYGVAGGIEAVPGKTADQIEEQLDASIGGINLSDDLAKEIHNVSVRRPDISAHTIIHLSPSEIRSTSTYEEFSKQSLDTLVEVQITEAGFRGGSGAKPSVRFYLSVHIRLLSTNDQTELFARDFQFLSRELPLEEWFLDSSRELISVFKHAVMTLSERIVDELFLVTDFPFDSGLWALPGQPEFGTCWFLPIYPEIKYSTLWDSIRQNSPGIRVLYTEVDSVQPLLKWEPFPRPRDQKESNLPLLNKISDVTYDLKIWETINDYPEKLVYDRTGLLEPQHQPIVPLKPGIKYFWTFRARYKLAGQSQVTRWAFSSIPSNTPSDYPVRRPGGTCDLDAIPNTNYFRFITPE